MFASVYESDSRTLYAVDLATGAVAAKKTFKGTGPLLPCLGPGIVAVRAAPTLLIDLVRKVLAENPAHPAAAARVRTMLPAGLKPKDPFVAADWLDFAEAVSYSPVEIVADPEPGAVPTEAQRIYEEWRVKWRSDLVAYHSRRLLIITPVERPGAVAICLSPGELMCATFAITCAGSAAAPPRRSGHASCRRNDCFRGRSCSVRRGSAAPISITR